MTIDTGPILTFTAPGHLPERPCLLLCLSPFLLQDSWEFPLNFLAHYRAEFPIEFTLSVGPPGLGMFWDHTHDELFGFPSVFPSLVNVQLSLTFSNTVWGMVQYPLCVYCARQMIFHIVLHK